MLECRLKGVCVFFLNFSIICVIEIWEISISVGSLENLINLENFNVLFVLF